MSEDRTEDPGEEAELAQVNTGDSRRGPGFVAYTQDTFENWTSNTTPWS